MTLQETKLATPKASDVELLTRLSKQLIIYYIYVRINKPYFAEGSKLSGFSLDVS